MGPTKSMLVLWLGLLASGAAAEPFDWSPTREESVIEVLTSDADGELRETPVWVVVIADAAYVRTNDSKWLANTRRGCACAKSRAPSSPKRSPMRR